MRALRKLAAPSGYSGEGPGAVGGGKFMTEEKVETEWKRRGFGGL